MVEAAACRCLVRSRRTWREGREDSIGVETRTSASPPPVTRTAVEDSPAMRSSVCVLGGLTGRPDGLSVGRKVGD